jgi:hypothetical protein
MILLCFLHEAWSVLVKRRAIRTTSAPGSSHKLLKTKTLNKTKAATTPPDPLASARQQQLKAYEEALKNFQQQKFHRAKQSFERVLEGPSKELNDRAQMHVRICEQRISRPPVPTLKPIRPSRT